MTMQQGTGSEKRYRHRVILFAVMFFVCAFMVAAVRAIPYVSAREGFHTETFSVCMKPDGDIRTRFLSEPFFLKKGIYTIQYQSVIPTETEIVVGTAGRLLTEDGADHKNGIQCISLRVAGGPAYREWRILAEQDVQAAVLVREYYEGNGVPQAEIAVDVIYRPMLSAGCYALDTLLFFATLFVLVLAVRRGIRHRRNPDAWIPLLLFGLVVVISLPLLNDAVAYGHDTAFHTDRIANLSEELFAGRIPARLSQSWKNGYGYPVSIFYGDIFMTPAAVLFRLGVPLFRAYQIYALTMNAVTVLLSFFCFRRISGNAYTALAGSTIYAGSARYAANLYLRGAIGEDSAMAVLPLVVLGFFELVNVEKEEAEGRREMMKPLLYLVAGFSALIQTHILSTIMTAFFAALFSLFHLKKLLQKKRLQTILSAAGITALLNAWFIVPFLDYYGKHSFYAKISEPVAGTAVSLSGLLLPDKLYKTIGLAVLILLVFCLCEYATRIGKYSRLTASCMVLSVLSVLMGTDLFPWAWLENHAFLLYNVLGGKIQFVWRYFSFAVLLVCVTAECMVREANLTDRRRRTGLIVFLAALAALSVLESVQIGTEKYASDEEGEMMRAADVWNGDGGDALYMFDDLWWYETFPETVLADEGVTYTGVVREGTAFTADVKNEAEEERGIAFPVWNYYGYRAYLVPDATDGTPGEGTDGVITDGESHRVRVMLPASFSGTVRIAFREPWYWRVSEIISLLTAVFICCLTSERVSAMIKRGLKKDKG